MQFRNNTTSRTNGFIAGLFFVALIAVTISVVETAAVPTAVSAQGSCGKDVCQNESGSFTINTIDNSQVTLNFSAVDNEVFEDEQIELEWDSENADDLQSSGDWPNQPRAFSGSASLSRVASNSDYEFLLTASNSSGSNVTKTEMVTVNPRPTILKSFMYENIDGREDIHAGTPGDVDLYLSWNASNQAGRGYLKADGDTASGQWQGDYSLYENNYGLKLSPGDYKFCLYPYDSLDQQNQSISEDEACLGPDNTITVLPPPPRYDLAFQPDSNIEIDGEPDSTASVDIALTSENDFDGPVRLEINESSLPQELIDSEGQSKIEFTFGDNTLSGPSQTTALDLRVVTEPIYSNLENVPITVDVIRTSSVNPRAQGPEDITFYLNADGYNAREIEEI